MNKTIKQTETKSEKNEASELIKATVSFFTTVSLSGFLTYLVTGYDSSHIKGIIGSITFFSVFTLTITYATKRIIKLFNKPICLL